MVRRGGVVLFYMAGRLNTGATINKKQTTQTQKRHLIGDASDGKKGKTNRKQENEGNEEDGYMYVRGLVSIQFAKKYELEGDCYV